MTCSGMPDDTAVMCAKMAEPIEMLFELCTRMGPKKDVLHGDAHWCHLANAIETSGPCASAIRPFCQITLTTCLRSP